IYYLTGKGIEKDSKKGSDIFKKFADLNYAIAQYYLSQCYELGEGVERDLAKSEYYLRLAAQQKCEPALKELARRQSALGARTGSPIHTKPVPRLDVQASATGRVVTPEQREQIVGQLVEDLKLNGSLKERDLELELERGLRKAAANNKLKELADLLRIKVNVNAKDKAGKTALHWAAEKGHVACMDILIKNGADTSSPDANGRIPGDYATNPKVLDLLLSNTLTKSQAAILGGDDDAYPSPPLFGIFQA